MKPTTNPTSSLLKVRILSPREVIFQGEALSVSSKNSFGDFDILPFHANFISLIENNVIRIIKANRQLTTFAVPFAILYQSNNTVNIYTDIKFK